MRILYGLCGKQREAKSLLRKLEKQKCDVDYEFERKTITKELLSSFDTQLFTEKMIQVIEEARQLKKLPAIARGELKVQMNNPDQKNKNNS